MSKRVARQKASRETPAPADRGPAWQAAGGERKPPQRRPLWLWLSLGMLVVWGLVLVAMALHG